MLLAIILAVLLTTASILATVSMQMETTLTASFQTNSKAQLERMNSFVNLFFANI